MELLTLVLISVAVASAAPQEGYNYQAPTGQGSQFTSGAGQFSGTGQFGGSGQYSGDAQFAPAQYNFQWDVNNQAYGNFYGHKEERDNDYTQGSYYVQLPDGRRLVVEYYADSTGYHPTITFEGEAQYPSGPGQFGQGQGGGPGQFGPGQGGGQGQGYPQSGPGPSPAFPQPPSQSYGVPSK
ncbi:pro-resilin-like [Penaeus japonicus]|uniref:pro-resilin-like n=1 Tax=Penaeus japonicus TaxID=27405 RepID=UPI001C713010|nr:pro-resilin-like [Penaeus japonicus]